MHMPHLESFSSTAFLIADPTRAAMLTALLNGKALPAGELAYAAGITAQTASSHLAKLLGGGLISVENQGRHRYYRLAGTQVAQALEYLAAIRPVGSVKRKALSPKGRELRFCRCCYDHLAGKNMGQTPVSLWHGFSLTGPNSSTLTPIRSQPQTARIAHVR
jgi:DNA-binding transcriptional ArsR family regulator